MGSLCTPSGVDCRLFHWFLGKCFFLVGVHPYMSVFCTFCKVLFLCLVSGVFLGDGMKGYGVFWNITGMVRVEQVLICTPVSIRKAFARMCNAWGGGRFPDLRLQDEDPGVRCSPALRT